MRLLIVPVLASTLLTSSVSAEEYFPKWPTGLQSDVVRISRRFPGQVALYVKDLSTGTRYTYNAATPMYLASGIKIPVMVALFRQIKAGQVSLDDELVYTSRDVRDGAPLLSFLRFGTPVSIQILLEATIQQSDNAATDMLIRHVGLENVNRGLVAEGIYGFGPITTLIDVRRLMYKELDPRTSDFTVREIFELGTTRPLESRLNMLAELLDDLPGTISHGDYDRAFRTYYSTGYNSAPVEVMGNLLEKLARGKVVSPSHSQQMVEVMLGTQTGGRRIRGGLPPNTPLAHKTGTQYRRTCDFSIFFMPDDRQIVFAVSVKGGGRKRSEAAIARIAQRAYWHLTPPAERSKINRRKLPEVIPDDDDDDDDDIEELPELNPEDEDLLKPALRRNGEDLLTPKRKSKKIASSDELRKKLKKKKKKKRKKKRRKKKRPPEPSFE